MISQGLCYSGQFSVKQTAVVGKTLWNKEGNIFSKVEMPHYACFSLILSSVNLVTSNGNKHVSNFLKMCPFRYRYSMAKFGMFDAL